MRDKIISVIFLGIVVCINLYFRMFPVYFPQLKSDARNIVEQRIRDDAYKQIDERFHGYNALAKDRLAQRYIKDYKKNNKGLIQSDIDKEYKKLKDRYQDIKGQTYLMELDCWHWARYVKNIVRLGHIGDKVVDGRQLDTFMTAPLGSDVIWNRFLFYFSAFLYKAFSLVKIAPIETFLFYLPLLFTAIFIITLYLFCLRYWNQRIAIITSLFVGLSPAFLNRSMAGWFDMDILNLFFPLIIVWTYLLAYHTRRFYLRIAYIIISAFFAGLFCWTWGQWWFILLVIIMYEIYLLLNAVCGYLQYKNHEGQYVFKEHIFFLGLFLIFTILWIGMFCGTLPFSYLSSQFKNALVLNTSLNNVSIWPNVFFTVSELRRIDFTGLFNSIGGFHIFLLSFSFQIAMFLFAARSKYMNHFQRGIVIIFTLYFMSMLFASLKGIRFCMFIVVPLGFSFAFIFNQLYGYLKNLRKWWAYAANIIIVILLSWRFVTNAYGTSASMYPLIDDAWYKGLTMIKKATSKGAIINSWWDFGDWFKAVAERRVVIDGQSQNSALSYWIANTLMVSDEKEALANLRMLNNGGNKAFEIINTYVKDDISSVLLLKKLIRGTAEISAYAERKAYLKKCLMPYLPESAIRRVSRLFFDMPGEAYLVVDSVMRYRMRPLSYVGNWDFARFYIVNNINKAIGPSSIAFLNRFGIDRKDAGRYYKEAGLISNKDIYKWIAPQLDFYSGLAKGEKKDNVVLFDNSIVYNPETRTVYIYSSQAQSYGIPKSLFIFEKGDFEEVVYTGNNMDFSVLIFQKDNSYYSIMLDEGLVKSIFVRLYFLDGEGMRHFRLFRDIKDSFKVFEIIWN